MQLAKPAHAFDQVAALTGVTPAASDPGQPVRLALRKTDTDVAQVAPPAMPEPQAVMADTIPQPEAVAPQFAEAASPPLVEAPETVAPAAPPADPARVAAGPAPASVAIAASMAPDAPAAFAAVAARLVAPAPKAKPRRAAAPRPRRLASPRQFRRGHAAWRLSLAKICRGGLEPAHRALSRASLLPADARPLQFAQGHLLAPVDHGLRQSARSAARCQLLKNRGGNCFVRGFAGDAPVQIAAR